MEQTLDAIAETLASTLNIDALCAIANLAPKKVLQGG